MNKRIVLQKPVGVSPLRSKTGKSINLF